MSVTNFRYVNEMNQEIVFSYENGFISEKPEGIDTLTIKTSTAQGVGQIGVTLRDKSIQPRPINMSGTLCGINQEKNKNLLQFVVRPELSGRLYADNDWFIDVVVTSTPVIGSLKKYSKYQFQLTAPYPFWQSCNENVVHIAGVSNSFKFPWNVSRSYQFGNRVAAKYLNIVNNGYTACPFQINFKALDTVVNPILENMVTGEFLKLEKTLMPNELITVQITHEQINVTSSIDGECSGAIDLFSNLYRLQVGDNLLKPDAAQGLANLDVYISFYIETVGVTL